MISVIKLTEILSNNYIAITSLLEEAGFTNISINKNRGEIRFSYKEDSNPTSSILYVENLKYILFSKSESNNLYTLLMDKLNMNFPSILKWITKCLNIKINENITTNKTRLPFGGFYKELIKIQRSPPELNLPKYDISILEPYNNKFNTLFFNDGISYETQHTFNIGYDVLTNRITIPEYDVNGNLIGIMGRINKRKQDLMENEKRWFPIIPCSRSMTLYGYHYNYKEIIKNDICYIGESEKFVMQLHSMNIKNSLALGTCSISQVQADYIKSLRVKKIILCFDEGLKESHLIEMCKKIKSDNFLYKNEVGYVIDKNNDLLAKGLKESPSDKGFKVFKKLISDYIVYI